MALSRIWVSMICVALAFGAASGRGAQLGAAAAQGVQQAVDFCLTVGGMICLWSGVMELMRRCGIAGGLSRLLRPVLRRLFPHAARDVQALDALTDGARDGLKTVMRIFPALVALLTAVSMLRASGALEALTRLCAPILARLGIPPETAMLLLVRPISGSGALAAASDIIQTYGADSRIGRTAAVMLGSTETTFYVLAVYFGACGIRHSRWAIPAAIVADVTGFVTAAALVRCLWGT